MSINYNPSTGLPYVRTNSVTFTYNDDHVISLLRRGLAIFAGGSVFKLDTPETELQFRINKDLESMTRTYPLRDMSTGEVTDGSTTAAEVIQGLFSIMRAHELEHDSTL